MSSAVSLSTPRVQNGTLYFVALLREELGRRIAAARTSAGLSQQQLAALIGLKHAQDVSRYERGKVDVPSHRIDLIAEATGRPRSYFVRDPSEPEPTPSTDLGEIAELRREVVALRRNAEEQQRENQAVQEQTLAALAEIRSLLEQRRSA
jgi:transcriptional regulator with XRE-family HTH domain